MYSTTTQSILANYNAYKTSTAKTTNTSKNPVVYTLGAKTIAAQQKLSNQYGVATFTTKGAISTVPTVKSGGFSDIYVGLGAYSTFDDFANAAVQKAIDQEKQTRQDTGRGITVQPDPSGTPQVVYTTDPSAPYVVADPNQPTRYVDVARSANSQNPILTNVSPDSQGLATLADQAKDFVQKYGIWIGGGIGVLLLLKFTKVIK